MGLPVWVLMAQGARLLPGQRESCHLFRLDSLCLQVFVGDDADSVVLQKIMLHGPCNVTSCMV